MDDEEEAEESACYGGTVVEEYVYRFPDDTKVLAVPKDVDLASGKATYRATYALDGSTLTVRREFADKTDRNLCSIASLREFAKLAKKVGQDLKAQVVYQ